MNVSQLVKEVQAYEANRARGETCGTSWIQPLKSGIVLNGQPHSGLVAHICSRRKHGGGEPCQCACGKTEVVIK